MLAKATRRPAASTPALKESSFAGVTPSGATVTSVFAPDTTSRTSTWSAYPAWRSGLPSAGAALAKTTIRPSSLVTCRRPRRAWPAPLSRGGAPSGCERFTKPPSVASQTCLVVPSDPGRLVVRCMPKTAQQAAHVGAAHVAVAGVLQEDVRG